jgi:glycosyltransferase involved in cell wall biosynthesis
VRVAVVNNFFPPRVGGSSHLADSLAQGYAAAGHEVLVLTAAYQDAPEREVRGACQIVRLPSWTLPKTPLSVTFDIGFTARPSLLRRVRKILDDFQPDVIHQHGQFFDLTWATGIYARKRKIPTLLSVHTRLESPIALYRYAFRFLDGVLVAPILNLFKPRFVVMDVHMDEYIRKRYRRAISGMEYIPVGVDPGRIIQGDGAKIRERHGLGDRPVILSIGHVIPLRDRVRLVRALPGVLAKIPDAAVVVVGGVYYDEFLKLADELGVRHAIHAVGAVPKAEIPDYLAAADLECHDLDGWGLGTASLESMAAGCPVVAALRSDNFPGIELRDREQLYLIQPGDDQALADAIVEVLADPAQARATVGAGGQRLVRDKFTISSVIDQHLDAFGSMVATRQATG